jgi:predicted deacetylase
MRYVIFRDDDTNAFVPIARLEQLYRPLLERGFPVNLSVIPNVCTTATYPDGRPEAFLMSKNGEAGATKPIGDNPALCRYLLENPLYKVLQHGCRHELIESRYEFAHENRPLINRRLDEGIRLLREAGFPKPSTFVAPYDQLSPASFQEAARRFRIISTGWYELRRLPFDWWPRYFLKRTFKKPHWRIGNTLLLSHPGCHLSHRRPYATMLEEIIRSIESRRLTVLVTHWWEYFRDNTPDEPFIQVLHETADYLASRRDIQVISFDDLAKQNITLN